MFAAPLKLSVCGRKSRWTTPKHRPVFKVPIHVTHYKQIETTIAIVVEPAGAGGPPTVDFGKLVRDVAESTVAIVVIQAIGLVAGDKQIHEAIVVVISGGNAHAVTNALETGVFGHVFETSVGLLLV